MDCARDLILDAYCKIEECYNNRKESDVIYTDFVDIDWILGGLRKSELTLIASQSCYDNTSFALNLSYNAAKKQKTPTLYLSLGYRSIQNILGRYICIGAEVNLAHFLNGQMSKKEYEKLNIFITNNSNLVENSLSIQSCQDFTIDNFEYEIKLFSQHCPNGIIVIDSFDEIKILNYQNRYEEYCMLTRRLKNLSKSVNMPILLLCQLNIEPHQYPKLEHLKSYDALVQDCDNICFIHENKEFFNNEEIETNQRKLIIAKHRHGQDFCTEFFYNNNTHKFKEPIYITNN